MKRMISKLRSRRGESLSETLLALLISALALMMLAGAVSSGANIVTRSNTALKAYYEDKDATTGLTEGQTMAAAWSTAVTTAIGG